jgi:hypothetical protein
MSRDYATPLEFQIFPSRIQRYFQFAVYFLVVVSILMLPGLPHIKLALIILLLLYLVYLEMRCLKFDRLIWQQGNQWLLQHGPNQYEAKLLGDSVRTAWLVILNFRIVSPAPVSHVSVVIWPDSVRAEIFRRLKVRLRVDGVQD